MSVRSLLPLLVLALAMPASGSTLEELSSGFVSYQFDGDGHHDAPDTCAAAQDAGVAIGASTDGMLFAPDDVSDVFLVEVPADQRGKRMQVTLSDAIDVETLELTTFVPGCAGTVFDASNWPTPEPSPPAPAEDEHQVALDGADTPRHCRPDVRVFWVEVMPGYEAAPTIHVAWTDGSAREVPITHTHGSAHALYASDHALGTTLKGAWVNMPDSWSGRFVYVAGPCDAVDGGAVYGEPPVAGVGFLAFTPTQAGLHAVQVMYREVAGIQLRPVPAPVSLDPGPFLPFGPEDAVQDPTGTLGELGLGHDHAQEARTAPLSVGSLLQPTSLRLDPIPQPSSLRLDPSSIRVEPPAPLVVPMSCHMCIGGVEDLGEKLSYRLTTSLSG